MLNRFKHVLFSLALILICPMMLQAGKPIKIACIGDSITYGHGIDNKFQNSYPGILQQMLGEMYDVRNFGQNYCTLLQDGDCPFRKQQVWNDMKSFLPDIVTIKLGTNDTKSWNWQHGRKFGKDLSEMLDELEALPSQPEVYLCRPIPSRTLSSEKGINDSIMFNHVIPIIDSVAVARNIESIDLYHLMLPYMDHVPDRLHPDAEGAEIIASEIYRHLKQEPVPEINLSQPFPGKVSEWNDCPRYDFVFQGRRATVVTPRHAAPGRPWIWRPAFFDAFPSVDKALLEEGYHVVYLDLTNMFACPESIESGEDFYDLMTTAYHLSTKVTLEGFSRGGYYVLNWAAVNPGKVANIYVDAPVCDIASWPGELDLSQRALCCRKWGISDSEITHSFRANVIHHIDALRAIPIIAVCGGKDRTVPYEDNFLPVKNALEKLGADVSVIIKENGDHHPHSLEQPAPIVDFILNHTNALAYAPRIVVPLVKWRFSHKDLPEAAAFGFDDNGWEKVTVPHDWAIREPFDMNIDKQCVMVKEDLEEFPKLRTGRTGALPCFGIGWYRIVVPADPMMVRRQIRLEIDGAMSNSEIYANGIKLGGRPYGYTSFAVDLSEVWKSGQDNVIAIRLDNKVASSRWYPGAGLYRNVRLVLLNDCHIRYCGSYIRTEGNKVLIDTELNKYSDVVLRTEILDETGMVQAASNGKADKNGICHQILKVRHPDLWSPESPTCYYARTRILRNGEVIDEHETRFGFRQLEFDPDEGFKLNGKKTVFKGVCMHHDLGPLGAAVNVSALRRQLTILKDMGCNAIRTSHNPPAPELVELCDKMGIMLQVEAFDEWKRGKNENGYYNYFDEWAEDDIKSMVRHYRNSPSVIMWSIGNEVGEQDHPDGWKIARTLTGYVKELDQTRPVTGGFNSYRNALKHGLTDEVDLVGFNYRPYAYAEVHESHPDYILFGSETASTVSSRGVYKFPAREKKSPLYEDYHVSSYDLEYPAWASTPDTEFEAQENGDFVMGEFVWTGFDYLGEPTPYNEGTPAKSSYFGIVDLAGLPKDRFYLYRSHWNEAEQTLHLLPHWTWPGKEGMTIPVHCYTSYDEAELFVNGKSYGRRNKALDRTKYERYRLIWENVVYEPGELKVVAYQDGVAVEEEVVRTAGVPYAIRLLANQQSLDISSDELAFVEVQVVDKNGTVCPNAANMLFFEVEGGHLKALCNGDPTDQTAFSSSYMRVFNGKMIAVIEGRTSHSEISLKVISANLQPVSLTIRCE